MSELDDIGFEPIDSELGDRLRAAAPEAGDPDAALATLRPRLVRARRRRRTGFVAASAAALALLGGVAFAIGDTTPSDSVKVPPANRTTPAPTIAPGPVTHVPAPDPVVGPTEPVSADDGASTGHSGDPGSATTVDADDGPGGSDDDDGGAVTPEPEEPEHPEDAEDAPEEVPSDDGTEHAVPEATVGR